MQYYKDLSMTMVDDNYFVGMLEAIWGVSEDASTTVTKNEMEQMVRSIRHKLLDLSVGDRSDEYVLRQVFREFDTNKDGVLSAVEFDAMLRRIQIRVPAPYVEALLKKFDRNGNGVVEFEEMLSFLTHNPYKWKNWSYFYYDWKGKDEERIRETGAKERKFKTRRETGINWLTVWKKENCKVNALTITKADLR